MGRGWRSPALVWDTAIGQSTVATGGAGVANLFYRGLLLSRLVRVGDTLRTTTETVARRDNRVGGRAPLTGLCVVSNTLMSQ